MIIGTVNADGEAVIPIALLNAHGREQALDAIIDTGFSGYLTLPQALVDELDLPWQTRTNAVLGDGSFHELNVFAATVLWDGHVYIAETVSADVQPLVGMAMLRGYAIEIHVREAGLVRIQRLP